MARLSFSTKLTDYFSSGNAILAIGSKSTAPMKYLLENKAALIAENKSEILEVLQQIICNFDLLEKVAKNAYDCGVRNYNPKQISCVFNQTLSDVCNND